jgi:predicted histidine transporter YuiF (NhaC family)
MSPIAGLLVEYFIIGAVASLWFAPLLLGALLNQSEISKDLLVVAVGTLIPATYVVGMVCDFLGHEMLHSTKKRIEREVASKCNQSEAKSQEVHATATAYEPALALQLELRSSRDRVVRGAMVACLPLLILSPFGVLTWQGAISGFCAIIVLFFLWQRMQKLSAKYECAVRIVLKKKHGLDMPINP